VVVIDSGRPRNAPAHGVHGLLGHDGRPPGELLELGRTEVRSYGGHVVAGEVVDAVREGEDFRVTLADGRAVRCRRLLVTSGLVDELPPVERLAERWGRDVLHCPYCHGWEVRGQAIGVLATGPTAVHQALLFSQLSDDVTLFSHTGPPLEPADVDRLEARGVQVVDGEVAAVEVSEDRLSGVRLADGRVLPRDAVVVAPRMAARARFLASLGLTAVEHPSGVGEHVPAEPLTGRTAVPGVWVAGNVTEMTAQVGASAAAGAMAGAQINADLVMAEADAPARAG
jgi:thioredoxin reductase